MAVTNVERYLTDLAYALDYAYNTTTPNQDGLTIANGQNSSLLGTQHACYGPSKNTLYGCNVSRNRHTDDLVSSLLKLRNPSNILDDTQTVTSSKIVSGYSAYNSAGELISGSIICRTINDICVYTNCKSELQAGSNNSKYTVSNRYPQILLPAGSYPDDIKIGFDLQGYNSPRTYAQSTSISPSNDQWNDLGSAKPDSHVCNILKVTTPKGFRNGSVSQLGFSGADYRTVQTVTVGDTTSGSGQNSIAIGYYPNPVVFKYSINAAAKSAGITYTGPTSKKLAFTPSKGWWSGNSVALTNASYNTQSGTSVTGNTGYVSYPSGYYSNKHSVTTTSSSQFTFVIDSDSKFQAWVNNTSGNDYTAVLIKSGTWSATVTALTVFNFNSRTTKLVVGETGSQLIFVLNASQDFYIFDGYNLETVRLENINIAFRVGAGKTPGLIRPFYRCRNLINCTVDTTTYDLPNTIYGFHTCHRLFNCVFKTGVNGNASSTHWEIGFQDCEYLSACRYYFDSTATSMTTVVNCFSNCKYLNDCTASINIPNITSHPGSTTSCFSSCVDLTNCNATVKSGACFLKGFGDCKWMISCTCDMQSSNPTLWGFAACTFITNCESYVTQKSSGTATNTYAFYFCDWMTYCEAGGSKYTAKSRACHSTATDAAGNTLEGGWNKV